MLGRRESGIRLLEALFQLVEKPLGIRRSFPFMISVHAHLLILLCLVSVWQGRRHDDDGQTARTGPFERNQFSFDATLKPPRLFNCIRLSSSHPYSTIMNAIRSTQKVAHNNIFGVFKQVRNRRDQNKRVLAADTEVERRAYLFIARNTSLPATVRYKAQLGLNALQERAPGMATIKDRCVMSGKGRGVLSRFKLSRVGRSRCKRKPVAHGQYQFRMRALTNNIPGMHKSSW